MDSESMEGLNLSYRELKSFSEDLSKKVRHSDAKATRLAGAFVIFEAIMFTQEITPAVGKRWVPVCLSAWVSVAFWLTFITTVSDCLRLRRQLDLTFLEQERLYRKIFSLQMGQKQTDGGAAAQQSLAEAFAFRQFQRYAYAGLVHLALLSYTLLVLYALLPQLS